MINIYRLHIEQWVIHSHTILVPVIQIYIDYIKNNGLFLVIEEITLPLNIVENYTESDILFLKFMIACVYLQ